MSEEPERPKKSKVSQAVVPGLSLEQALRVPTVIAEQYGKAPTRPLDVAAGLEMSPSSGPFRRLCGASIGYGLTDGGPNASTIVLTDLSRRIMAPLVEGDDLAARRQAVLTPTVVRDFLKQYDGSPLPAERIAYNVLENLGVPSDRTKAVFELIVDNAERVGFLKKIKEKTYVDISAGDQIQAPVKPFVDHADPGGDLQFDEGSESVATLQRLGGDHLERVNVPAKSNAIFVGHGSNKRPLEQLVRILNEYGIPHKEAIAEPNAGRPIPIKVADTMRECGAAILIFTADQKYFDEGGNEIWMPSENVAHELGAASVLYDNRIVIFKEDRVSLASNFNSIGYIEFETDKLSDKGIGLFRELVSFKIVNITVGSP